MKILMLTDRMDAGGAETHIASLCASLSRAGEEVTLLSPRGRAADVLKKEGARVLCTPPFSHSPTRLLRIFLLLWRLCRREKFDILHAHARLPALLCRLLPRHLRPVTVVTVHARYDASPRSRRLSFWGDHTVAVSEDLRVHTSRLFGVPYGRVTVIPNGIDLSRFTPPTIRGRERDLRILFASRLDEDCSRGARLLLRLLPRLLLRFPTLTLTVAGGGSAYPALVALATDVNRKAGRAVVTLTGHVEDMPALLREHGIFVGVSRAAMEAAACGCAVLLLGDEGYLGILNEITAPLAAECNLTCREHPHPCEETVLQDLSRLLSDAAVRKDCARVGMELVRRHFDLSITAERTRALYFAVTRAPHAPRLLLGGYFGEGNLGDDAILTGVCHALREIAPDVRLEALTGGGRRDAHRFGIPSCARRSPLAVRRALMRADLFLCGGGSLLQNKTSNRSLLYYLTLIRTAHALGTPPILFAAGVGPLIGKRARAHVCRALTLCTRVSLRDPDSARLLRRIGVDASLHESADPALLCPLPSHAFVRATLTASGISSPYVCLILKGGEPLTPALCSAVAHLGARGISPVLLVLDGKRDLAVCRRAARLLGAPLLCPDVDELLAILSHASLTLTARLHAMILSSSVGVPAVGLLSDSGDPKISSFASLSHQSVCDARDKERLSLLTAALLDERDARVEKIRTACDALRKKAKKDLEMITRMLYNIDSTK